MAKKEDEKEAKATYKVVVPFQDKFDSNISYDEKSDISHFDADRLADLENRKIIAKK